MKTYLRAFISLWRLNHAWCRHPRPGTANGAIDEALIRALCQRENMVTENALNTIECLPVFEELDAESAIQELSQVLGSLANGKAPGKGDIPAKLLECCKDTLISELHNILCLC